MDSRQEERLRRLEADIAQAHHDQIVLQQQAQQVLQLAALAVPQNANGPPTSTCTWTWQAFTQFNAGTTYTLYLDGVQFATGTTPTPPAAASGTVSGATGTSHTFRAVFTKAGWSTSDTSKSVSCGSSASTGGTIHTLPVGPPNENCTATLSP